MKGLQRATLLLLLLVVVLPLRVPALATPPPLVLRHPVQIRTCKGLRKKAYTCNSSSSKVCEPGGRAEVQ
uniref:Uncharacterized protein n=1 Tax=Zea mays TaxID=4577 RepID=C0PA47_MAIZE|nr:unknown [Zea mays]